MLEAGPSKSYIKSNNTNDNKAVYTTKHSNVFIFLETDTIEKKIRCKGISFVLLFEMHSTPLILYTRLVGFGHEREN